MNLKFSVHKRLEKKKTNDKRTQDDLASFLSHFTLFFFVLCRYVASSNGLWWDEKAMIDVDVALSFRLCVWRQRDDLVLTTTTTTIKKKIQKKKMMRNGKNVAQVVLLRDFFAASNNTLMMIHTQA